MRHTCQQKRKYKKKDAITMRNFILREHGRRMRAYPCPPPCDWWHLTKQNPDGDKLE